MGTPAPHTAQRLRDRDDEDSDTRDYEAAQVFVPVCRDPEAAGLVRRSAYLTSVRDSRTGLSVAEQEAQTEAEREERSRGVANNKAWGSG